MIALLPKKQASHTGLPHQQQVITGDTMAQDRPSPRIAAIVVAAGQGLRAGQPLPKQFAPWRGKPVVRHSVEALVEAGASPIIVVIPPGADVIARDALGPLAEQVQLAFGGATRQDSVRLGLEMLRAYTPEHVLIHDAARPGLTHDVIARLTAALTRYEGAIPVLPVVDSLVVADGTLMGMPAQRETLRRVQTPQAFRYDVILAAQSQWNGPTTAGDDAQVARAAGMVVALVEGEEALHKLTYAADFEYDLPFLRVGNGYDVHRLAPGEELWLCGVRIEHDHGLAGHSDADVAIHALVDALLGALGEGDIGQHFPPSDPQWRGASSDRFLAHAGMLMAQAGYRLSNADVTIICEAPKIGPHRDAMRERLAVILGVDKRLVSVKATTTEKLGFTGRGEGIAAHAVASLVRN